MSVEHHPEWSTAARCADGQAERQRLQDEVRRRDEFLAVLAHELRDPLASIRNALEAMRLDADAGPGLQWSREVIDRQARHLSRLVDDLLDISAVTQGRVQLRHEPTELAAAVAQAVEARRPLIDSRRQELTVTLPPYPLWLNADPTRLVQILGNLLTNASKYTPEGGHIVLAATQEGGEVVVRVRDDGIGIRPDTLPRLFTLFTQTERALPHAQGGLGIGLALVKSLVELHGGRVSAHSDGPGRGSEFTVWLPALQEMPQTAPAAGPLAQQLRPQPGRRVLVVDDNVDAADSLSVMLQMAGHEVRVVHEGTAVVEAAREFRPDVVLLDIGLPGGPTGYDLARQLRLEPGLEAVPLVAVTGYGREEDKERAQQAGFDAHLTKPAEPQMLLDLVARGRRPAAGGGASLPGHAASSA
jgi:CheY-like chemotaxis protein